MTSKAQQVIKDMQQNLEEETYLRFGVNRPCCNQMNYSLTLSRTKKEQEEVLVLHDIKILIDPSDSHFTDLTEIDFEGDGFIIRNPNPLVSPII
ncbi:HesB/IscA family protein [Peribacillus sp. NPDC060253]|uniref:HesB/IscA family protein n=1 Tax=Peribacillus sp. NPDC060253 TaxID=3347084 RepID=UPI00364A0EF4